jgi:prolyl-tRNA editing enzyme YbaK/EbsC (Cys-tRNA(Pro) deacylase)
MDDYFWVDHAHDQTRITGAVRAVPPFGGSRRDPVIVDIRLAERDSVVLEAGSHEQSTRNWIPDLLRVSAAEIADICKD